jgi:hypothetical protein
VFDLVDASRGYGRISVGHDTALFITERTIFNFESLYILADSKSFADGVGNDTANGIGQIVSRRIACREMTVYQLSRLGVAQILIYAQRSVKRYIMNARLSFLFCGSPN